MPRGGLSTTQGYGPFATGTLNDALFGIQTFVALCALVGMVLCADLAGNERAQGQNWRCASACGRTG
ncbi:hypothetical protein LP419_02660 [Massilia sp. H-1]|nr:hypothetical protein LP419_02660 [Massilia sp. H-1]